MFVLKDNDGYHHWFGDKFGIEYLEKKFNRPDEKTFIDESIFWDGGGMISFHEPMTEVIDVNGTKFQTFISHAPYFLDMLRSLKVRGTDESNYHYAFQFDFIGRVCVISIDTYTRLIEKLEDIVEKTREQAELLEYEKAVVMEEAGGVSKRLCICQSKKTYRECCGVRKEENG